MNTESLEFSYGLPVRGYEAGIVIARDDSRHMTRIHAVYDLLFVRTGVLSIREEDRDFEVGPGQALLLWPERLHQGTKTYPPDLRYFWLHFEVLPSHPDTPERLSLPQFTTVSRPDYVAELFLRYINDHEENRKAGRQSSAPSNLLLLLILHEIAEQAQPPLDQGAVASLASRAQTYIRIHYRRPLTPAEIAAHVGCGPQYLSRVFRRVFHQTMTDAIHQARIEYARFLLSETDRNVSEIAYHCGFTDAHYFYRLFRRYEGMTALAYRQLHTRRFINVE